MRNTQVVVLMGGMGTRLGKYSGNMPKSMADVHGRPFFDYQLQLLKSWGFQKYLFLVGYRSDAVENYYGDGSSQNIQIAYSHDGKEQLGTGGALRNAAAHLEDSFLLIYGDSFMDINYLEAIYRFRKGCKNGAAGLMTILRNQNAYDKSNVLYRKDGCFLYDKKNTTPDMQYIDYGVSMLQKSCILSYAQGLAFDIAELLTLLSKQGRLVPQLVSKRFYEIGRPESLDEFRGYVRRRFLEPAKAVFLDRDGVINEIVWNEDTEQLDSPLKWEEFHYKPKALEALSILQEKGYLLFIVTNQPAAAKGKISLEQLYDINTELLEDLKEHGIQVEAVAMCPHHPQGSPHTKETFLIKNCECRKPKPGLLMKLKETYCIDWSSSYMVGDSYTDVKAGQAAGLKTVFLGDYKCDTCARLDYQKPDHTMKDLAEFAAKAD